MTCRKISRQYQIIPTKIRPSLKWRCTILRKNTSQIKSHNLSHTLFLLEMRINTTKSFYHNYYGDCSLCTVSLLFCPCLTYFYPSLIVYLRSWFLSKYFADNIIPLFSGQFLRYDLNCKLLSPIFHQGGHRKAMEQYTYWFREIDQRLFFSPTNNDKNRLSTVLTSIGNLSIIIVAKFMTHYCY